MLNLVVLRGHLARPAEDRVLPSGSRLVALEVTVPRPGGRAESVPVAWFDAPAVAGSWDVGRDLVVFGRVRRRFFRAGGTTQSRTEVVADQVVPASHAKRVESLLQAAAGRLREAEAIGLP